MKRQPLYFLILVTLFFGSCVSINLFEKQVNIPSQEWTYEFSPAFNFEIKDTTSRFLIYVVLRHSEMYRYNNIWLKVGSQAPGDTMKFQNINLQLASGDRWDGRGIDDIYEVRKLISPGGVSFRRAGEYTFSISQIMRDNPLKYMMNAGIRIEKIE